MIHPYLKTKYSKISGKGLFASKKIPKGSITWVKEIDIRSYEPSQIEKFSERYQKILKTYSYFYKNKVYYSTSSSKYFNHSCDPNILPLPLEIEADIAVRDIEQGTEATYEYGFLLTDQEKIVCQCRSANCRRIITQIKPDSEIWNELEEKALRVYMHYFKTTPQYVGIAK